MLDMVEELELVTKHSRLTNWCEKNFDVETRGRGHATIQRTASLETSLGLSPTSLRSLSLRRETKR